MLKRVSLSRKLSFLMMATSSVALLLAGTGFLFYEQVLFRRDLLRELTIQAEIIGKNSAAALTYDDPRSARDTLGALRAEPRVMAAAIYGRTGLLFATYRRTGAPIDFPEPGPTNEGHEFGSDHLSLHHQIRLDGERIGAVTILCDLAEMRSRLARYGAITLTVLLASWFAAFLASLVLRRIISRPILQLADTARAVSADKRYSLRAATGSQDEIGILVDSFNEMLGQIEVREHQLQEAQEDLEKRVVLRTQELQEEITDRIRIEKQLRRSELRFRSVAYSASDAIVSADSDGHILSWSHGAARMYGWTEAEVLGKDLTRLMPERFHARHREGMKRYLETGEKRVIGRTVEMEGVKKDGLEFPIELSIATWKSDDGTFFSGIIRDISERKAIESEIRQLNEELEARVRRRTSELEAANRELAAFSYSVSHDLRAPLQSIDGFSQALAEDYGDRLDAEGLDYLRRVRAASQRMGQLIDDMLTLSRVTRGELRKEDVDLGALAQDAALGLKRRQPGRDVAVVVEANVVVKGDARLLRIVLDNLMSNAWKFTGRHETARIEFGVRHDGDDPVYFVKDDGAGFDMAYAAKLFGAFQRLHSSEEFVGTGIGLATVQRIIHRHGGHVWAEGEVDKGATIFFTIPEGT